MSAVTVTPSTGHVHYASEKEHKKQEKLQQAEAEVNKREKEQSQESLTQWWRNLTNKIKSIWREEKMKELGVKPPTTEKQGHEKDIAHQLTGTWHRYNDSNTL